MQNFTVNDLVSLFIRDRSEHSTMERLTTASRMLEALDTRRRGAVRYYEDYAAARDEVIAYFKGRDYLFFGNSHEQCGLKMSSNKEYIIGVFHLTKQGDNTMSFGIQGDPEEADTAVAWFKDRFKTSGSLISTATHFKDNGSIAYDKTFVNPEKANLALQEFYPWLDVPLREYYKLFMDSKDSILVMYGPPGTGKSTLLRSLILASGIDAMLGYNKQVVESPLLLNAFFRSSAKLLGYEDIDKNLRAREDGNTLMSSVLNAADGVVEYNKKLVFVTNLPNIDKIDSALLRAGRCFDILEFRLLSIEEAQIARAASGLPLRKFDPNITKVSLAEALAEEVAGRQVVNRFGRKPGFA